MSNLPARRSQQVAAFLDKQAEQVAHAARLIFALDATCSRQPTWDSACHLQAQMFTEAAKLGSLQVQLVYYRDITECWSSMWTSNAQQLTHFMTGIHCRAGHTQIGKVLTHIRRENAAHKVSAAIFVGDAMEENQGELFDAAAGLGVPLFLFQEGNDELVEGTFTELARLTNGAFCCFEPGAEAKLAELLKAVGAFAVGGLTALADQRTEAAKLLLMQLKK